MNFSPRVRRGASGAAALELFDRFLAAPAVDGGPTPANAWIREGQALEALGRRADAIAALEMALELAPGHAAAAKALHEIKG